MYDDRFYNLLGQVKSILEVVIDDYDIVCVRVVKEMFNKDNEIDSLIKLHLFDIIVLIMD